ncbi:MAG: DUF4296 domain-containing protein [Bacteroidetes bacterium]|nr:DUF4296 domain-containing protein [Bacteroidota bacterium]
MERHSSLQSRPVVGSNLRDCFVTSFLAITLSVALFSCGQKAISIPPNVLPKGKMAQVLTDIHLAEAEANPNAFADSTQKATINFQQVFEKDTITKKQYEESLTFYIAHPELLNEVYEEVVNELSKKNFGK